MTFTPPSEVCHPEVHQPVAQSEGTVWGVCKVGEQSEGKFGEVKGRDVLGGLRVYPVEVSYKPPHTLDILRWCYE